MDQHLRRLAFYLAFECIARAAGALVDLHPRRARHWARRAKEYLKEGWQ